MADLLPVAVGSALVLAASFLMVRWGWRFLGARLGLAISRYREAREAERRADLLLRDVLTPPEYASLAELGYLDVRSRCFPSRVYRVPRDGGLIILRERGRVVGGLCVQPTVALPVADVVAMHKLMIEGAETEYLRRANQLSVGTLYRYGLDMLGER